MKKSTFLRFGFATILSVLLFGSTFAQKTVRVFVPGTYPTIQDALVAEFASTNENLVSGDSLVIQVAEGFHYPSTQPHAGTPATNVLNLNWPVGKNLHVLIQGAGAGLSIFRPSATAESRVSQDVQGVRFIQLFPSVGIVGEGLNVGSFTIKDMTFQYMGSYRGAPFQGAVLFVNNNGINDFIDAKLENVVFDNCVGASIFVSFQGASSFTVDNCLFKECVITYALHNSNSLAGMINKADGKLTVKNTTFYGTEVNDKDGGSADRGVIIRLDGSMTDVVLENNAFINTRNTTSFNTILPLIYLRNNAGEGVESDYKLTLKNNIMIGNLTGAQPLSADILLGSPEKITMVESSGNILNKAVKLMDLSYEDYAIPGSKIDPTYTYTDPRINFVMEGDIPKLTNDSKGVGEVQYTGDGGTVNVKQFGSNPHKIYSFNRNLVIEGLETGATIEIFTVTGSVYTRAKAQSDRFEMELPKGIYLIRTGSSNQKVMIR
jgi:hypothetical protein